MKALMSRIEVEITAGTKIPKPRAQEDFVVKTWGMRRGQRALIYSIPNHKNPNRPYEKGITIWELEQAFSRLTEVGDFTRSWFIQSMPNCAKEGGCNFTTIGGIFVLLGFARYGHGRYRYTS